MRRARAMVFLVTLSLGVPQARAQVDTIAALISRHFDSEALAELGALDASTLGLTYVRGVLLFRLGAYSDAADDLCGDLGGLPDALRSHARRVGLQALARADRCGELLSPVYVRELQSWPLGRALRAECLSFLARRPEAITALRSAIVEDHSSVDTFALRALLVRMLFRTDDVAAARHEAREAYLLHPQHPEAEQVLSLIGDSNEAVILTPEERLRRAIRLDAADEHTAAAAALVTLPDGAALDLRRRWLHARGMALFRARGRYAEAAEDLRRAAGIAGPTNAEDAFHAARALSRADRDLEAIRGYRGFVARHGASRRAPEAEFLAGWLELRHGLGDGEGALRNFIRSRRGRANPRWSRKARWQVAMAAFDAGRYRVAAGDFQGLAETGEGAMEAGRAWYWFGRTRAAAGQLRDAERAWRRVLRVERLHWYALLAASRLRSAGLMLSAPFGEVVSAERLREIGAFGAEGVADSLPEEIEFLRAWGFHREAAARLRRHEASWVASAGRPALVAAYWSVGAFHRAFRLGIRPPRGWMGDAPRMDTVWRWSSTHPRPWPIAIAHAGMRFGIGSAYLYGIMRQESAFAPHVQSYAGARGLLQLMPETARRVAGELAIPIAEDELFIPEQNILLGAALSGQLLREFSGVEALAIGAYNAGAHRMRRWLRERGAGDLDRFVEAIPIGQTRNYIRRVSSHQARYRALEEIGDGWPALPPLRVGPALIQGVGEDG